MQKNTEQILVPFVGNHGTDKAFSNVLDVARKNDSKIHLLTCLKEKISYGFFKSKSDKIHLKKQREKITSKISKWKTLAKKFNIPVKTKVVKCDIASKTIIDYAKDHKIDLITMTKTHPKSHTDKIYLEETTRNVFNNSPCSFLYLR
ncbi:universal stress protein [Nitrosopumilus sp. S6]